MESIKFSNFKGFGGEHSIDVADLTLIYGENSAGKSSLLELLRLAWTTSSCEELGYDPDLGEVEGPLSLAHRRHQFGKRITITRSGMDCGRVGDGPWTRSITTEWAFEHEEMENQLQGNANVSVVTRVLGSGFE